MMMVMIIIIIITLMIILNSSCKFQCAFVRKLRDVLLLNSATTRIRSQKQVYRSYSLTRFASCKRLRLEIVLNFCRMRPSWK